MTTTSTVPLRQQIREWLAANPGFHRPKDIATALGVPTHPVAVGCRSMAESEHLVRDRRATTGTNLMSVYAFNSYREPKP